MAEHGVWAIDWSADMDARLRQLWDRGDTVGAIATLMSLHRSAILRRTHKLNLKRRDDPKAALFWSAERCKVGSDLRSQGKTWAQVAATLGGTTKSAEHAIGQWRRSQDKVQAWAGRVGPMSLADGRGRDTGYALPPGHPLTWGLIAPGVPYPGPGHV